MMESFQSADDDIPSWASFIDPQVRASEPSASSNGALSEFWNAKTEPSRRRGRPRSSIFAYYRRIEDDNGIFVGNQCSFCSFVSRDKSENPTYLSRHIRRACHAPDHVKEAVSLGKPPPAVILPVDTPSRGNNASGNHRSIQSVNAKDRTCSQSPPHASRYLKTSLSPEEENTRTAWTVPNSTQMSYALKNKSAGITFKLLSPLLSGVEKSRRVRQPALTLKGVCGNDVETFSLGRNPGLSERHRKNMKFLRPRPFIPSEVKARVLSGLQPQSVFMGRRNPYVSTGTEEMQEPSVLSRYDSRSTKMKLSDRISSAIRFLLAHHSCFRTIEDPVFCRLPFSTFQRIKSGGTDAIMSCANLNPRLPSEGELLDCLTNSSRSDIINGFSKCIPLQVSSGHLIICFADTEIPTFSDRSVRSSDSKLNIPIASYFCLTSDIERQAAQLFYIGSRNFRVKPFTDCLSSIIDEAQNQVSFQFRHILLSRSVTSSLLWSSPHNGSSFDWTLDIRREVDALCRELLTKVPFLKRIHRRNRIIATFFLEQSDECTGRRLFGGSDSEMDVFQRYRSCVSGPTGSEFFWYSCHVIQSAVHTCNLLHITQAGQLYKHRISEMHKFLTSLSEENCGNVALCREVVRLILSPTYLKDLMEFVSFLKPLTNIIYLYCSDDATLHWSLSSAVPRISQPRSIGYVLHDCTTAFNDMPFHGIQSNEEVRKLKDHVYARLFKEGPDGLPPIVSDVCYLAAILNPAIDVDTTFLSRSEVLLRAVQIAKNKYKHVGVALERGLLELQNFKNLNDKSKSKRELIGRSSTANTSNGFEYMDPLVWWVKYGERAPELRHVALQVLVLPATSLSVIHFITNTNANCDDLRGHSRDSLREKRRFTSWNLKLGKASLQSESVLMFSASENDPLVD